MMKKTYIAPFLRTVELGSEAIMTLAISGDQTTSGFSAENEDSESSIWSNDSWSAADEN